MHMIRPIAQSMQNMFRLHLHAPMRGAKLEWEVFAELVEEDSVGKVVGVFVGGGDSED